MTQTPLPDVQPGSSSNQFLLTIPETTPAGLYNITAVGTNASGAVESAPVAIDVEPQFSPSSVEAQSNFIAFSSVGNKLPIRVIGTFDDDSTLDVTHSSRTTYSSNNTQVATVTSDGNVTAVGPGETAILIKSGISPFFVYGAVYVQVSQAVSTTGPSPVITSVTPTTGVPGTTHVTITGSNFGSSQGSGFVQLGDRNGVVSSWSDSQIVATVAAGAAPGVVEVDQGGLYSNQVPFAISTPVIRSISPVRVVPGMQMTITGSGFGATRGSGFVTIGNQQGAVVSWSSTQIVATVAAGTRQGSVYVYQGGVTSNLVNFARIPPVITSISPTSLVPGMQMTITGTGFENAQYTGQVSIGNQQGIVVSWTDTQIVATMAPGARQGTVSMQQGAVGSNSVPFTRTPPTITSISPTALVPGMQMTITGTGFENAKYTGQVSIGNQQGVVVSWTDTQIVATMAAGARQGTVSMQQGGVGSNSVPFTRIPPTITSISPTALVPGMQMTITGTGFENAQYTGQVSIGNQQGVVVSWTDTQIVATMAAGARQGTVSMQQGGVGSNSVPFTRIPPTITSISPTSVAPGMQMTITGTGFENAQYTGFVGLANKNGIVASWSDTQIVVAVPAGTSAGSAAVQQGAVGSNSVPFTLSSATLTSIAISPTTANVYVNGTQQYQAIGTYSDGSTQNLTVAASWSSSNTSKATISNSAGTQGLARGVATGTVTVTATFGGISGNASLVVQFPPS